MATELGMIGCDCGCDCCQPGPANEAEERELLLHQKRLIDQRLAQLQGN
ncbi:MAG TPA: hypothetical protein VHL78_08460 [Actinomycetota bacterium]|nr:hypothetical protein [Actinomycetota bacterium]